MKMFILGVVRPDDAPLEQLMLHLQHWVKHASIVDYEKGLVDIPEGDGDIYVLPVRVGGSKPCPTCDFANPTPENLELHEEWARERGIDHAR
jgi:hypothetical protein